MLSREHSEADLSVQSEGSGDADLAHALELGRFVLRAPRRHRRLAAGVFIVGVALTLAAVVVVPRTYTVDTTILFQRNVVIPLLGNPRRAVPPDWDVSNRGASEYILRPDNLRAVIQETGLEVRWEVGRSPILKLKDALTRRAFGPMSEEDMRHMLVKTLEKKLSVQADDATIKLSLSWHHPETAYQLVSCLEQRFLKDRSAAATSPITDTIGILVDEEARQREALSAALAEAQRLRLGEAASVRGSSPQEGGAPNEVPDRIEVEKELAARRRALQGDEARLRRLTELRAQLAELRITYAPLHPLVLAMQERIRQAQKVPPGLAPIKQEEDARPSGLKGFATQEPAGREAPSELLDVLRKAGAPEAERDDPELAAAKTKLNLAVQKREELRDRIESARLELQTAEAAFKYRYAIVRPPELPERPTKPNALLLLAIGLAASIVLAVAAAFFKDLASDRFIEPWQVRKRLPIPLLGELDGP
jgi:uncharacterized protein involved in exopolysaccharide biosynthesis